MRNSYFRNGLCDIIITIAVFVKLSPIDFSPIKSKAFSGFPSLLNVSAEKWFSEKKNIYRSCRDRFKTDINTQNGYTAWNRISINKRCEEFFGNICSVVLLLLFFSSGAMYIYVSRTITRTTTQSVAGSS